MSDPRLLAAIPMLRVASIEAALPTYEALGFSVAWQHQLSPDAPRLTSVRHGTVEIYLTEHPVAPRRRFGRAESHAYLDRRILRTMVTGWEPYRLRQSAQRDTEHLHHSAGWHGEVQLTVAVVGPAWSPPIF